MRSCVRLAVGEEEVASIALHLPASRGRLSRVESCVEETGKQGGIEDCSEESGKRGKTARGKGKQDSQASMRGGDGVGVSALEPHLEHVNDQQQSGRPARHSGGVVTSLVTQVGGPKVGSSSNARETSYGILEAFAASSSKSHVGNGTGAREVDAVNRGMIMQSGESSGHGGGVVRNSTSKVSETGRTRSRKRGGLPSNSNVNGVDGASGEVPAVNGCVGNGSIAQPSKIKVGRTQRHAEGAGTEVKVVDEQPRSSKRRRNGLSRNIVTIDAEAPSPSSGEIAAAYNDRVQGTEEKEADEADESEAAIERVGELFPSISDDLGIQCLTRLPRHRIYHMALVCKKWKEYLLGPELYKQRQLHNVREDWVFMLVLANNDKRWRAFLPNLGELRILPACPCDYTFEFCDKESMVAGLNLLVLGQKREGYVIWKFDTIKGVWSTTPKMHSDRCMFGSASLGRYAYFAGGSSHANVLKAAERYDSEVDAWEQLAEMNHKRKACSGFVMDRKFHVIGGHVENGVDSFDSSGEAYDPQTNTWTLIEGMWPREFIPSSSTSVSPPLVAVLNNKLYAVDVTRNILMLYNREHNNWKPISDYAEVPFPLENSNGWGLAFKAVGSELFVIGGGRGLGVKIHAYRPRTDGENPWRLVTDLKFHTNGFIYNCAVMSG